jgi:hypothetical protein
VILDAEINPDFTHRPEPSKIIEILRRADRAK